MMRFFDSVLGCIVGGAIGDCVAGVPERKSLCLSDDTQLTLATCESIRAAGKVSPEHIAATMLRWFCSGEVTGLGSSTLKASATFEQVPHWALRVLEAKGLREMARR